LVFGGVHPLARVMVDFAEVQSGERRGDGSGDQQRQRQGQEQHNENVSASFRSTPKTFRRSGTPR
jgi:hypothetical protein